MEYLFNAEKLIQVKLMRAPRLHVALDYDGTLTPIVTDPRRALLPQRTREMLQTLASNTHCLLTIVSGRCLSDLVKFVDVNRAYYVGNHGLEIRGPRFKFVHAEAKEISHHLPELSRAFNKRLAGTGASVEDKGLTLSVHYRNARQRSISKILSTIRRVLRDYKRLEAVHGKKVVDVRPRVSWNKGMALEFLMQHLGRYPDVYVGDDRTDEYAFMRLKNAVTILVSPRPKVSAARYYLRSTGDVARFLRLINSWLQEGHR